MSKRYATNEMLFKAILLLHTEIVDLYCVNAPKKYQKEIRDKLNDRFYDNLGEDDGRREEEV